MEISAFLNYLTSQPTYSHQIVHIEHIPPREEKCAGLAEPLETKLQDCLRAHSLSCLYTHQTETVNNARRDRNVMVATTNASGKSLCYNIAVLQTLLTKPDSRALYLFPTKALAHDQLRALQELFCPSLFRAEEFATFDGDTPPPERAEIRKRARIILTNPDISTSVFCPIINLGRGCCAT